MTSLFRRHARGRPPHPDVLTPAEWRVLEELRRGRSNPEIAERLGVTLNTVKTHVSSMLAKLDLHDRAELARWQGRPASPSRSAPGGLLALLRSKRGSFLATAGAGAVVAAFGLAMYVGGSAITGPDSAGLAPVTEATSTVPATAGLVPLADLNLPRGRIVYRCELRWCSISTDGSGQMQLTSLPSVVSAVAPSPDGTRLAYFEVAQDGRWLGVANIDGSQPHRLAEARAIHDPVPPVWSPDGRTIYVEHGSTLATLGTPIEILAIDARTGEARVLVSGAMSGSGPAISRDGSVLAFDSGQAGNLDVFTVPSAGDAPTRLTTSPAPEISPVWTPDSRLIYAGQPEGNWELLVMNADGSGPTNLTRHPAGDFAFPIGHFPPPVSPDGNWVAFQSERTGAIELYIVRTDGSGNVRAMTTAARSSVGIPIWSPDSLYLAYSAALNDRRGMWITRIADGATAYLGDGLPAAWLP